MGEERVGVLLACLQASVDGRATRYVNGGAGLPAGGRLAASDPAQGEGGAFWSGPRQRDARGRDLGRVQRRRRENFREPDRDRGQPPGGDGHGPMARALVEDAAEDEGLWPDAIASGRQLPGYGLARAAGGLGE